MPRAAFPSPVSGPPRPAPPAKARRLRSPGEVLRDREGGLTVFMLFWMVGVMALGGFAIDTAKAWRMRAMMQAAADASAHAALQAQLTGGDPGLTAKAYIEKNLPTEIFGEVLRAQDIEVGGLDLNTGAFDPESEFGAAVRVSLYRAERNDNPEPTTFLRILGIRSWNVSARAVAGATTEFDWDPEDDGHCVIQGVVARGNVGWTSNNRFDDVCVHGEAGVTLNNNNVYEAGTIVSMPEAGLLNQGRHVNYALNEGLADALEIESQDPAIVDHVDQLIASFALNATPLRQDEWRPETLRDGDRWYVHCREPGRIALPSGVFDDVQITTNCRIDFGAGATWRNSVIGSTDDAAQGGGILDALVESILYPQQAAAPRDGWRAALAALAERIGLVARAAAPQEGAGALEAEAPSAGGGGGGHVVHGAAEVNFGAPDACVAGGGSLLVVDGAMQFAAKMGLFGSTVIASGDVRMAAQSLGIEGPSILSGGDISLTANSALVGCTGADWRIGLKQVSRIMQ